jgi:TonB family protein
MIPRFGKRNRGLAAFLLVSFLTGASAQTNPKTFAFVNQHYVITAEVSSEHAFVVNFINLSDFVIVIQPSEFIYKGASGRFYNGQVYEREMKDSKGETQKYSASVLLKGHSFTGLAIVGSFHEQDSIVELSVRIGAKRFYMQPLEKVVFEQLAAKIGELDLDNPNGSAALTEANLQEMGMVRSTDGTSEWDRDWQGLMMPDGINPPKIIEKPVIAPTPEARKSRTYGKVRLSGTINKSGGIQDLKVIKGLGRGLDQRALDGVKNSWMFLPATKNGEVLETIIPIEVEFPPPEKNP